MTSATISVIIPAIRPDEALTALIKQLSGWNVLEIFIVTPEGSEFNSNLNQPCKWLTAPKGRGSQIQAGLNKAQGDILWILHSDNYLPEKAISEVRRIIQTPSTAMGCFPVKFNSSNLSLKLFAAFSHLRTSLTTFGDQGFFFHHKFKEALPDLTPYPLLEDVIIYRALRKKGHIVKANYALTTDARRFKRLGVWRTQWRNALTLWRFRKGVSAQKLYDAYYS